MTEEPNITEEQENVIDELDYKKLYENEHDKYIRALADYQNLQRRTSEQLSSISRNSFDSIIEKILSPFYNDIKRGVISGVNGCDIILKNLITTLDKHGVEIIIPEGDYNSDTQVAITTELTNIEHKRGKIAHVIEDGMYDTINKKVIVYSKVIVFA